MESRDAALSGGLGNKEYGELRARAEALGLYKRTYWHYGLCAIIALIAVFSSLYVLTLTDTVWIQAVNAIVFAFFSVQLGMIGHDLSHGEVFNTLETNRFWSSVAWGLFGGLSEARWFEKHNRHHTHPNHIGYDPDIELPFMFTENQVDAKSPFLKKWILPYQHVLFWPALAFVYPMYILLAFLHYLEKPSLRVLFEILLVLVHFGVLFYIVFSFLPLLPAFVFLGIAFVIIGIYMGAVFAPNHKGRPELRKEETFTWLHQILLTRDVRHSFPAFYLCGGLNFQIEHHLFPTMSRAKYHKAQALVKEFSIQHGIEYHETSWVGSLKEMYQALKLQSDASRTLSNPAGEPDESESQARI